MSRFQYQFIDQTFTVLLERQPDGRLHAVVGDAHYEVSAQQMLSGAWRLRVDGRQITVHTAADGLRRWAQVIGRDAVMCTLPDSHARRRASGAAGHDLLVAQMPGQVLEVYVQVGDSVQAGQALMVLEAMKMEIRVTAPHDGQVTAVFVGQGQVVDREQRLLDIDNVKGE